MGTENCLNSWDLRSFILFRDYGAKWDYSCKVPVVLMFWERKNERLELVKNLGSENKQNVTTIYLSFIQVARRAITYQLKFLSQIHD